MAKKRIALPRVILLLLLLSMNGCKPVEIEATIRAILSLCFSVTKTILIPGAGYFIPDPTIFIPQICDGEYPLLPDLLPGHPLPLPGAPIYNCLPNLSSAAAERDAAMSETASPFLPLEAASLSCSATPVAGIDVPQDIGNCEECCNKVQDILRDSKLQRGIKAECTSGELGDKYRDAGSDALTCIDDLNNALLDMAVKCGLSIEEGDAQAGVMGP